MLGIGTLAIQTAGSGSVIPEENLVGLDDAGAVYQYVAGEVRRFRVDQRRGSTVEKTQSGVSEELLTQILYELRFIRNQVDLQRGRQ